MSQPNEGQDHLDYRETEDVTEIHASVLREHPEPRAGSLPIPTWLAVLCTAALCWAGAYIGMFHGGFSSKVYNEYDSNPAAFFPLPGGAEKATEATEQPLVEVGGKTFMNCMPCHGPTGMGSNGVPPLSGSEWVDGPEHGDKRLISILLKGIGGSISVKGQGFNGAMPPWESLKDRQIAGVITYIRQSFGNKGTGETTEAMVKAVRKELKTRTTSWTEAELKGIPVDAKIEGVEASAEKPAAPSAGKPAAGKPGETKPTEGKAGAPPAADASAATFNLTASIGAGNKIYLGTCLACHQPTGLGLPGAFPPLAKSEYANGDPRRLVAIVLKGIAGAITVDGKVYAVGMPQPDIAFPVLKEDKNIADVLNYVRNSFGNKNDTPITPELVTKTRQEFASRTTQWTEAELKSFPAAK